MATWTELMDLARDQLSDEYKDTWSDQELIRYFGYAQTKACQWGYLNRAEKTITLVASTITYDFPANVLYITRLIWGGSTNPLSHKTTDYMDRRAPGWDQGEATGNPQIWVSDFENKKLKIYRTPDSDAVDESATLTATCVMLPETSVTRTLFEDGTSTPEIESEFHEDLVDYVMYRAHLKDSHANGKKYADGDLVRFMRSMNKAKAEHLHQMGGQSTPLPKVSG